VTHNAVEIAKYPEAIQALLNCGARVDNLVASSSWGTEDTLGAGPTLVADPDGQIDELDRE